MRSLHFLISIYLLSPLLPAQQAAPEPPAAEEKLNDGEIKEAAQERIALQQATDAFLENFTEPSDNAFSEAEDLINDWFHIDINKAAELFLTAESRFTASLSIDGELSSYTSKHGA